MSMDITPVLLGAPAYVPSPEPPAFPGVEVFVTGWNGDRFALQGPNTGVHLRPGTRMFGMPEYEHRRRVHASVHGSQYAGRARAVDREMSWQLRVWQGRTTREWVEYERRFWRIIDPDRPLQVELRIPGDANMPGETRYAEEVYPMDDGAPSWGWLPGHQPWMKYVLRLSALDPFWRGEWSYTAFDQDGGEDFLLDDGSRAFYISPERTLANATASTDGDLEDYPLWVLHGPVEPSAGVAASFGINGRMLTVPFAVDAGQTLAVFSHPTDGRAVLIDTPSLEGSHAQQVARIYAAADGQPDRQGDLTDTSAFGWLPPYGEVVPLQVTVNGPGGASLGLYTRPSYRRAI